MKALIFSLFVLGVTGCSVGPNYHKPEVGIPDRWRWAEAQPRDEEMKGTWWEVFNDSELNHFQQMAGEANQDLKAAVSRVDQARAQARVNRSEFFPNVTANPSWQRYRTSSTTASGAPFALQSITANDFKMPIDLSYEVDLWGRVRRSFESARNEMLSSTAAYYQVLFTLNADVAINYFRIRELDHEIAILNEAVEIRQRNRDVFEARLKAGYSSQLDVTRSQTELANAKSNLSDAKRRRAEFVNALAVLCGVAPSNFVVESKKISLSPPEIKPGLPSEILERRPDVAQAERRLAARNAEIGVEYAAFFPSLKLTGSAGFQSAELEDLFKWDSRVWSFGPSISIPITTYGVTKARVDKARAAYEEAIAQYRQTVLVAFREVDDSLAALIFLKEQADSSNVAKENARKTWELAILRYKQGLIDYFAVIDSERSRLEAELQSVRVDLERMLSTIRLIKAFGGGWSEVSIR